MPAPTPGKPFGYETSDAYQNFISGLSEPAEEPDPIKEKAALARKKLDPSWGDPTAAAPASSAPMPEMNAGGSSDLLRVAQRMEGMANAQPQPSDAWREEQAVQELHINEMAAEHEKAAAGLKGLETAQQTLMTQQKQAVAAAQEKLTRAGKLAQYPSLTLDEIEQHEKIANGKDYNPEQKRAAQLALKRASEVDPNRLMNQSTATKIMAGIAQALGAFAAVKSRTPNFAMQVIEQAIDRDIMAQKMAFDAADRSYQRERTVYSDLRTQFHDEQQARDAHKSLLLQSAAQMAERYKSDLLASQLNMKAIEHQDAVKQQEYSNRLNALARAGGAYSDAERLELAGNKEKGKGWLPPDVEQLPDAEIATDKTLIRSVTNQHRLYKGTMTLLDKVIQNRGNLGAEVLNRVGIADAETYWARLFARIRQLDKTGAHLSPQEAENIKKQIGENPTAVQWLMPRLLALQESLTGEMNAEWGAIGGQLKGRATDEPLGLEPRVKQ